MSLLMWYTCKNCGQVFAVILISNDIDASKKIKWTCPECSEHGSHFLLESEE